MQGLSCVLSDTEAKAKVELLILSANAESSNFIDYSGFMMVAYNVDSNTIKNIKKKIDFFMSSDGKTSICFEDFAKKLLGQRLYDEKPDLVKDFKASYAVIDKDGSNDVDINELKE